MFMHVQEVNTEYLGRAIASLRTARGMKRMDLKRASGLSYPYIAEIENGSKKSPSLKAIAAIAAALGVSPAELQGSAEELKAADTAHGDPAVELRAPDFGVSHESTTYSGAGRQASGAEDFLMERIAARVLEAIEPQVRELIAREVRYAIREEILQQREVR